MTEQIKIIKSSSPASDEKRENILENPGFGLSFTDHMVEVKYSSDTHWHDGQVKAFGDLNFSPAMMVFHYGQAIFEGLKAYRTPENNLVLFRPEKNAQRLNKSAERMAMPMLPEEIFIEACDKLVRTDENWVPSGEGQSLYLRPFMIASEQHLGLRAANQYLFMVIASPVAPFFSSISDVPAISIYATDKYVRAVQGGTGAAKCSGNYAASLIAKDEAYEYGCQDVLWRDAKEQKYIEEMGTSNVCFVSKSNDGKVKLITPELSGSILDGITRDSILTLAQDRGYEVVQEHLVFNDVLSKLESGEISEVFSCGTAVTISPVGAIVTKDSKTVVGDGSAGEVTMSLRSDLIDIQYGRREDPHGWVHIIK
ncbi:MAG: branched-chain amino acid aminotransferase [Acidimicrobiia bacterium]